MTAPQDAPAGPVLGEEQIAGFRRGIAAARQRAARTLSPPEIRLRADRLDQFAVLLDEVERLRSLVSQARADGAAEERERIARAVAEGVPVAKVLPLDIMARPCPDCEVGEPHACPRLESS